MSDTPFGFSNPDDDPDRKKDGGSDGGASGSEGGFPFGFGAPGTGGDNPFGAQGFDPSQLGQMLSQFGQMLSGMGSAMGTGESGPVNYDVATKLARQQIGSVTPVSAGTADAVRDAARSRSCGSTLRRHCLPVRPRPWPGHRSTGSTTRSTRGSVSPTRSPSRSTA